MASAWLASTRAVHDTYLYTLYKRLSGPKTPLLFLARSTCLPKGLYILRVRRVEFAISIISVIVSQIITKFGECQLG